MSDTVIRIKPTRTRKQLAPRTCCPTHTDTCRFGRRHTWSEGWYSETGVWQESSKCFNCDGVCDGEL